MKILMINKFLHPNGGSETYIFKLGEYLIKRGHEVQYFGMEHEGRCVGNAVGAYTADMDFHTGNILSKITYPIKTIYSTEARRQIRKVLEDFKPEVCHLNNFNYQLTPSIILEIKAWSRKTKKDVKIVFTAHDYQLLCPNHMFYNPNTQENCEDCMEKGFISCTRGRCIHGSRIKSIIGTLEAVIWRKIGVYKNIDYIICCSEFLKSKMDKNPVYLSKTIAIHNFIDKIDEKKADKDDYVIYFGRLSQEKGIDTLLRACQALPDIRFIFAGTGPLVGEISSIANAEYVGFKKGDELERLIREAKFSVYPSKWYENCPFSVMESQAFGTPVIGANIGGIPELIKEGATGLLFEPGNVEELVQKIKLLWEDKELLNRLNKGCMEEKFDTVEEYYDKIIGIYQGEQG